MLVDWIIRFARRTPFFHLEGYMERWWFVRPCWWFPSGVRVHHILRSDNDRCLHDHPWPYMTIILRGGYYELTDAVYSRWDGVEHAMLAKWYGPGSILFRRSTHKHRLILPANKTAWTLFFMGPYQQGWGFYTPEGKVPWREYLNGDYVANAEAKLAQHYPAERVAQD